MNIDVINKATRKNGNVVLPKILDTVLKKSPLRHVRVLIFDFGTFFDI